MVDWGTVKLPRDMVRRLSEFVETNYAKNSGFTSKSQVVVFAVREFLRNYSSYLAFLDYLGFEKNIVKLMDHELGAIVNVKFDKEEHELFCNKHNSDSCDHVRFLWMLPRFKEDLKGLEIPSKKPKIKIYTEKDIQEGLERIIRHSTYKPKGEKITKKKMVNALQSIINDLQ